ncbi:site-specific integrase [Actinopolymorpha sp. B9G3]|uniref:tyrosine-type recombinase/integrase n=1 Tax=Actinopolymorpha sp. B9G3 TaxID=3158970 RepID=UPI0032D90216
MAYAEKRGNLWRARWRAPGGTLESKSGFATRKAAEAHANDQEAAIRNDTYIDARAGRITLTDWVNLWFPALDLEPTTMNNYRYMIEVHILPVFGDRALMSLTAEEIAIWERKLVASGLSRRTAHDARSTLTTVLADAIPRYIQANPAARRRGKGRKGQRRIARIEKQRKAWATPLQALLVAERAAVLSRSETDFVMILTLAYTGMRWSEVLGLPPDCIHGGALDIHWKLYELNGRFYRGRPKDGSMRTADLPPFLGELLAGHLESTPGQTCTCRVQADENDDVDWCAGSDYVFLGPQRGHFRRSNYSERVMRPVADGWYPGRRGGSQRARMPVLVNVAGHWPGKPFPPWPAATPGVAEYQPPAGRGRPRITEDTRLASWLPLLPGLSPHGLRHGHQTWMDEVGTSYVLQSERMGHEVPGMRGVYSHISTRMRTGLVDALQALWAESLEERARIAPHSAVASLDALLADRRAC